MVTPENAARVPSPKPGDRESAAEGSRAVEDARHGRLATNLVANVAAFTLNIAVGVFFTPYLIRHLGIAAYGVIPLATTLSSFLTVGTLVVNAAVARFITVAMGRGDVQAAGRYFTTSLVSGLGVVGVLIVPGILVSLYPEAFLRLPPGYEGQTRWLLACTVGVVLVSVMSSPLGVATFCRNRFDIRNAIASLATLARVGLVVVAFSLVPPRISHVGAASLLAGIGSLVASAWVWRRLTPELEFRWQLFDFSALKELIQTGWWVAINQLGTLLLVSIDLLVVNRQFGPETTGQYASLLQWPILLRTLALTLAGVLGPTVIGLYARHDVEGLVSYTRASVRVLGLAMALPIALISGLAAPILHVWLGPGFAVHAGLLMLMTLPLCVNLGYVPLHHVSTATNDVRLPGVVQVVAGLANLGLALWLGRLWGPHGVAAAGIIVLSLRNVLFTPLYAALIVGRGPGTFMKEAHQILIATAIVTALSYLASRVIDLATWLRILGFSAVVGCAYAIVVWRYVLSPQDKTLFRR